MLDLVARHEARHAVAAHDRGVRIAWVVLWEEADFWTGSQPRGLVQWCGSASAADQLFVSLAGNVTGTPSPVDEQIALRAAADFYGPEKYTEAIATTRQQLRAWYRQPRVLAAVDRVAAALLRARQLDGAAVDALLGTKPEPEASVTRYTQRSEPGSRLLKLASAGRR